MHRGYGRRPRRRLFHVGRLDAETEGLILITNDGELAHRLAHPSSEFPGPTGRRSPGRFRRVWVGGFAPGSSWRRNGRRQRVPVKDGFGNPAQIEVTLHVGRNRIVRRLLAEVGHPVRRLVGSSSDRFAWGAATGRGPALSRHEHGELLDLVDISLMHKPRVYLFDISWVSGLSKDRLSGTTRIVD